MSRLTIVLCLALVVGATAKKGVCGDREDEVADCMERNENCDSIYMMRDDVAWGCKSGGYKSKCTRPIEGRDLCAAKEAPKGWGKPDQDAKKPAIVAGLENNEKNFPSLGGAKKAAPAPKKKEGEVLAPAKPAWGKPDQDATKPDVVAGYKNNEKNFPSLGGNKDDGKDKAGAVAAKAKADAAAVAATQDLLNAKKAKKAAKAAADSAATAAAAAATKAQEAVDTPKFDCDAGCDKEPVMKRSECANWCAEQRTDEKVGAAKKGRADAMEKSMVQRRLGRFKVTAEALAGQGCPAETATVAYPTCVPHCAEKNKCGDRKCVSECKGLSVTDCTNSYMWSDGVALGCKTRRSMSNMLTLSAGATCTCERLSQLEVSAVAKRQIEPKSRSCRLADKAAVDAKANAEKAIGKFRTE